MILTGLPAPSKRLISRILTEVGFEERLIGYRFRERTGPTSIALYSFEEVVGFLSDPFPLMDFALLESWIRKSIGDTQLADRINDIVKRDSSNQDKTHRIRNLMEERLIQCKRHR